MNKFIAESELKSNSIEFKERLNSLQSFLNNLKNKYIVVYMNEPNNVYLGLFEDYEITESDVMLSFKRNEIQLICRYMNIVHYELHTVNYGDDLPYQFFISLNAKNKFIIKEITKEDLDKILVKHKKFHKVSVEIKKAVSNLVELEFVEFEIDL